MATVTEKTSQAVRTYLTLYNQKQELDAQLEAAASKLPDFEVVELGYYVGPSYDAIEVWDFERMQKYLPEEEYAKLLVPSAARIDDLPMLARENVKRFRRKVRGERCVIVKPLADAIPTENVCCYDIETFGDFPPKLITVVGMYFPSEKAFVSRVMPTKESITQTLAYFKNTTAFITYNGTAFDLPVTRDLLGVDLSGYKHYDLMFTAHELGIHGGLKGTEKHFGIARDDAVVGANPLRLWEQYTTQHDEAALRTLIDYNKADCMNLHELAMRLNVLKARGMK